MIPFNTMPDMSDYSARPSYFVLLASLSSAGDLQCNWLGAKKNERGAVLCCQNRLLFSTVQVGHSFTTIKN